MKSRSGCLVLTGWQEFEHLNSDPRLAAARPILMTQITELVNTQCLRSYMNPSVHVTLCLDIYMSPGAGLLITANYEPLCSRHDQLLQARNSRSG